MSKLSVLLKQLEEDLKRMDAPMLKRFNKGVHSLESYKSQFSSFPSEVETLYKWKNGVTPTADDMIGNLCFFSGCFSMTSKHRYVFTA